MTIPSTVGEGTISYGTYGITYTIERSNRRTLSITVRPDMAVHITAPLQIDDASIEKAVRRRAGWILRQQRFFNQFQPLTPHREYVSGETHLYLGRKYRLKVRTAEEEMVKLTGGYIHVSLNDPSDGIRVKTLLDAWYHRQARKQFRAYLKRCLKQNPKFSSLSPVLRVRRMERRWGSYSPTGIITLNVDLIRAPRSCIEYVIIHELCHLIHPNHSRQFYELLSIVMPNWEERKLLLEKKLS